MDEPTKTCNECGETKAATTEFFAPEKRGLHGVRAVCRECKKAYFRTYNAAHREERREFNQKWYADHHEEQIAYHRQWYADNREKSLAASAAWRSKNPNVARCNTANWRADQYGLDEKITPEDIVAVLDAQDGLCRWCGAEVDAGFHVDHAVPFARGGHNVRGNLAITCPPCNHRKWMKTPEEFTGAH